MCIVFCFWCRQSYIVRRYLLQYYAWIVVCVLCVLLIDRNILLMQYSIRINSAQQQIRYRKFISFWLVVSEHLIRLRRFTARILLGSFSIRATLFDTYACFVSHERSPKESAHIDSPKWPRCSMQYANKRRSLCLANVSKISHMLHGCFECKCKKVREAHTTDASEQYSNLKFWLELSKFGSMYLHAI